MKAKVWTALSLVLGGAGLLYVLTRNAVAILAS
jgi:hypothetical protein